MWKRLGDVPNLVEPFFGSGAMLLNRPHKPHVETVNDLDGFIPNFWRAIQFAPDEVAKWADYPVSEVDLHARHQWLVDVGRANVDKLRDDPNSYDAKIAGWWVWGLCQWKGSGWCVYGANRLPHLGNAGRGINRPKQKLPSLSDAGMGVHRPSQHTSRQMPHLSGGGQGINRTSQQIPYLRDGGKGILRIETDITPYFRELSARMRRVRVCCGDWSRVLGPSVTFKQGLTGIFLDPPYDQDIRCKDVYAMDTPVATDVRKWCLENGENKLLRIALCGYEGEHDELEDHGWSVLAWKAKGGYGSQAKGQARENSKKERVWFSPYCLKNTQITFGL